jgi:spore maturation protein CgeB
MLLFCSIGTRVEKEAGVVHDALPCDNSELAISIQKRKGYSASVRLFEAAACGVLIISDRWPGIETFFTSGKALTQAQAHGLSHLYLGSSSPFGW